MLYNDSGTSTYWLGYFRWAAIQENPANTVFRVFKVYQESDFYKGASDYQRGYIGGYVRGLIHAYQIEVTM